LVRFDTLPIFMVAVPVLAPAPLRVPSFRVVMPRVPLSKLKVELRPEVPVAERFVISTVENSRSASWPATLKVELIVTLVVDPDLIMFSSAALVPF